MLAERVGFEPTNRLPDLHLSRVPHYRSAIFPYVFKQREPTIAFLRSSALGSVVNNLFLPIKANIVYPYMYLLSAFPTPEIKIASSYDILVFAENARLVLILPWSVFVASDT